MAESTDVSCVKDLDENSENESAADIKDENSHFFASLAKYKSAKKILNITWTTPSDSKGVNGSNAEEIKTQR